MKRNKLQAHPNGHLDPEFCMDDVRSRSWKTRLLAPAAFIATVYNPDSPDIDDPTAFKRIAVIYQKFHTHKTISTTKQLKFSATS